MAHKIVNARDVEAHNGVFRPMRAALGATAFGINQLELPPGGEGPEHDHTGDGQEEVYVIIGGGGTVRIDGEEHAVAPGDYVFTSPEVKRQMSAGDQGLSWVGVGCAPGSYTPRG